MHPSSRGTVHITSVNAADKPAVDPAYLSSTVDRDLLVHGVRFGKKIHDAEPLRGLTTSYIEPAWDDEDEEEGDESAEGGISDEELREYVKNGLEPIYHPVSPSFWISWPRWLGALTLRCFAMAHLYLGRYGCHVPT